MNSKKTATTGKPRKRADSTRTAQARAVSIARREVRATYAKNGGRF